MMIDKALVNTIISEQDVVAIGLVTPDNLPHTTPVWISYFEGKFYFLSRSERAKTKFAKLNNNCMIAFKYASMRGKVKILNMGTDEFDRIKDVMDNRYSSDPSYDEYKKNWDVAFEITPVKLYR